MVKLPEHRSFTFKHYGLSAHNIYVVEDRTKQESMVATEKI
jgi:hypothetical protein